MGKEGDMRVQRSSRHGARRGLRAVVLCSALALVAGACGSDSDSADEADTETAETTAEATDTAAAETTAAEAETEETTAEEPAAENTASDTGVTETTIRIAIHAADLSGLVKAGAIKGVPEDAAQGNLKRVSSYLDKWNEDGGINGRTFEYELVTWDPADPKTYEESCQQIIDGEFFMVIAAGGGYPPDSIACVAIDGDTQYMGIDAVGVELATEMGANFLNLAPPSTASAQAGIESLVSDEALLPKDAKLAILHSDWGFSTDAYAAVKEVLDAEGYEVVYDEPIQIANLPTADANKNVALTVEKVKAAGADHVISMLNFTNFTLFPTEATKAGLTLKYNVLEISSGMCTAFSAGQLPPEMDGARCVTHWNNFRLDINNEKAEDTPFEAQCRAEFEAAYAEENSAGTGIPGITKTNPGVPYPGFPDGTGTRLDMDQSYYECNLMNVVKTGITGAGAELTHESFQEAVFAQGEFDVAGIAGGKGSLSADKTWLASNVQQVQVTANPNGFSGPPDADGLYQGLCRSPLSCYRTVPDTVTELTYRLGD